MGPLERLVILLQTPSALCNLRGRNVRKMFYFVLPFRKNVASDKVGVASFGQSTQSVDCWCSILKLCEQHPGLNVLCLTGVFHWRQMLSLRHSQRSQRTPLPCTGVKRKPHIPLKNTHTNTHLSLMVRSKTLSLTHWDYDFVSPLHSRSYCHDYLCHRWLYVPLTNDISPSCTTYSMHCSLFWIIPWSGREMLQKYIRERFHLVLMAHTAINMSGTLRCWHSVS